MDLTEEEKAELAKEAKAALEAVNVGIQGDTMTCIQCGGQARVHREPMSWEVECLCGWSAAGSGPPIRKN